MLPVLRVWQQHRTAGTSYSPSWQQIVTLISHMADCTSYFSTEGTEYIWGAVTYISTLHLLYSLCWDILSMYAARLYFLSCYKNENSKLWLRIGTFPTETGDSAVSVSSEQYTFGDKLYSTSIWLHFRRLLLGENWVIFKADHILIRSWRNSVGERRINKSLTSIRALHLLLCPNNSK